MNHADLIKSNLYTNMSVQTVEAIRAAIDAMQSELDEAVAARDKYMGLWAALSQDEGKAERAVGELEAKLAARDAEIERLRAVATQSRSALEKTMGAFWGTCAWHADVKKAIAAIDAALSKEVKDDWIEYRGRDDAALSEEVKGGEL